MPLKLTRTHQQWHSRHDEEVFLTTIPTSQEDENVSIVILPKISTYTDFPVPFIKSASMQDDGTVEGVAMPAMGNDFFGNINFKNLATTTSLKLYFRAGFEIQCLPGSVMSPHLKLSPPADDRALTTYFAIARELKDAYPADFNDLGEIWDVISNVADKVLPLVSGFGAPGAVIGGIGGAIKGLGDTIRAATRGDRKQAAAAATSGTQNATASAADVERVKEAVKAAPAVQALTEVKEAVQHMNRSRAPPPKRKVRVVRPVKK